MGLHPLVTAVSAQPFLAWVAAAWPILSASVRQGIPSGLRNVAAVRAGRSLDDSEYSHLRSHRRPATFALRAAATSAPSAPDRDAARVLQGSGEAALAVERGEADGTLMPWEFLKSAHADWVRDKKINIVTRYVRRPIAERPDVRSGLRSRRDRRAGERAQAVPRFR